MRNRTCLFFTTDRKNVSKCCKLAKTSTLQRAPKSATSWPIQPACLPMHCRLWAREICLTSDQEVHHDKCSIICNLINSYLKPHLVIIISLKISLINLLLYSIKTKYHNYSLLLHFIAKCVTITKYVKPLWPISKHAQKPLEPKQHCRLKLILNTLSFKSFDRRVWKCN